MLTPTEMISIYKIKPKFQKLLLPVLQFLRRAGVTANMITWSSIILSLGLGLLLGFKSEERIVFLLVPIGLFVRMALNALDGMMAKTYQMQSRKGEALNEAGDIFSDMFLYFPLVFIEKENMYILFAFILLAVANEFTGILAKAISGTRRYDGPMGKSDRAFVVGLYCLLIFFGAPVKEYSAYIFGTASLLILLSSFIRIQKALQ